MEQSPFSALGYAAAFHQVIIANDLGPDEAPLHVRMNLTRRLHRGSIAADGPCLHLVGDEGKKGDQPQQVVGEFDYAVQRCLRDAHIG